MSISDLNKLAQKLKSLHVSGQPVLLANVWDGSSTARIAVHPSTKAIATTSFGVAAIQGVDDNDMTVEQNLQGIRNVAAGLRKAGKQNDIPLSVDMQDGYSDPADATRRVIELGFVGCNIEDVDNKKQELRSVEDAVRRVRAVANAAKEAGVPDFVINARTDTLRYGGDISSAIERGKEFLAAGATTVFVFDLGKWDIKPDEVTEMVKAFGGRLALLPGSIGIEKLAELGVSRISVGARLWKKSMDVIEEEAVRLNLLP